MTFSFFDLLTRVFTVLRCRRSAAKAMPAFTRPVCHSRSRPRPCAVRVAEHDLCVLAQRSVDTKVSAIPSSDRPKRDALVSCSTRGVRMEAHVARNVVDHVGDHVATGATIGDGLVGSRPVPQTHELPPSGTVIGG